MSKDQVSGSVTLSLGGLADGLADRLAPMFKGLAADIAKVSTPPLYKHAGIVGVLTGYGVPYDLADHVAREMAASGKAMINVEPDGDVSYQQATSNATPGTQPESAVAWFEREVGP